MSDIDIDIDDVRTLRVRHPDGEREHAGVILRRVGSVVAALFWEGNAWREVLMPAENVGERTTLTAEQKAALPWKQTSWKQT